MLLVLTLAAATFAAGSSTAGVSSLRIAMPESAPPIVLAGLSSSPTSLIPRR